MEGIIWKQQIIAEVIVRIYLPIAVASLMLLAPPASAVTSENLYDICAGKGIGTAEAADLVCEFYLQAVVDTHNELSLRHRQEFLFCDPEQDSTEERQSAYRAAFMAYLPRHSEMREHTAALTVMDALKEAFPCPAETR